MHLSFLALIILGSLFGPIYSILANNAPSILFSCFVSLGITGFGWCSWRYPQSKNYKIALVLLLAISMPVFYGATGQIIEALQRARYDNVLLKLDELIMPSTHISFWLDRNEWVGPATLTGKVLTEILQISYFSYYLWGYFLFFYLLFQFTKKNEWSNLERFLCAWIGAYYLNFIGYILVPAIGPQFYFEGQYTNELNGFGLAGQLRQFIASNQATIEDCFPSGHTALSWITAIIALKLTPRYGKIATLAATMITLATVYLRFHYIVDLIAAIPLILIGLYWGNFLRSEKTQ